jgi:thiamine transport system substrate-binding protein
MKKLLWLLIGLGWLLAACAGGPAATPTPAGPGQLTVITHDSFDVSEEVVAAFEQANNARVRFLKGGDTGTLLNQLILSRDNPPADVFYGLDNTFLSRALDEDLFEPYDSPGLVDVPDVFELDPQKRALPVDYGDVCLNYDIAYFAGRNLAPPASLADLVRPEYKSLLVTQNPATSSPGLAFLLATIGRFGDPGYLEFWKGLVANDVLVVNDWETAYYTEFSRWGGRRPIVVSYSSSPPFEVIYAETPIEAPPTAAVVADRSCFRQIEFVGILKGAANRELAEKWVDFMLSPAFQEDMPLKMFVFPVNPQARLAPEFEKYLALPEETAVIAPQEIAGRREAWLQAWTETVLR